MNFEVPDWLKNGGGSLSVERTRGGLASSPSSSSSIATSQLTGGKAPGINGVEMPDWLSSNPDANIHELLSTYAGIGAAFDPKAQVAARTNAAAYNTSAGNQVANNAATEYANRAAQSGASSLGAGVVKAQALMPVLQQNAALKTDAADVAAKSHQQAVSLAAQVASTIGNLRTSYLNTLTGYAEGQQKLGLQTQQFDAELQQKERGLNLERDKLSLTANNSRLAAAEAALAAKGPSGHWTTDASGNPTSGYSDYEAYKNWGAQQTGARSAIAGMY